jgi:hypothetical protein
MADMGAMRDAGTRQTSSTESICPHSAAERMPSVVPLGMRTYWQAEQQAVVKDDCWRT